MKYSIITFGCRVNQADSLEVEERLLASGATPVSAECADVVVVNTCSVTATSDQGARQTIRRIARHNPAAQIVVTGCYATREPGELADLPGVVRIVPNQEKKQVAPAVLWHARAGRAAEPASQPMVVSGPPTAHPEPFGSVRPEPVEGRSVAQDRPVDGSTGPTVDPALAEWVDGRALGTGFSRTVQVLKPAAGPERTTVERFRPGGACGAAMAPGLAGRTAYTLRVQTGCDEPCTYCIIPATRGIGRSRPLDDVLSEVDRILRAGFKEIVLTGVHLGSYGRDVGDTLDLAALLRRLDAHRGDVRFRISSLEPMDCTPEVVDVVCRSGRFAAHFHLPLQHASDSVLAAMRRPYTLAVYRGLVDHIRAKLPRAAIGSDVIVGFPGETARDVELLLDYLASSPLTHLHVFPYSDRPGTIAATSSMKIPGAMVRERARQVREVGSRLADQFKQSQVLTRHRGLTIEDGSLVVTDNYLKVRIPSGIKRNEWVDVRVTAAGDPMIGEVVKVKR